MHSSNVKLSFRYELLNSSNQFKKHLTNVLTGSVANNALADIKRTARFSLRDDGTINFLSDRIKPYARLWMPPGRGQRPSDQYAFLQPTQPTLISLAVDETSTERWVEWPLGVFILSTPPRRADASGVVTRDVAAYDQLQVLKDDKVTERYTVTADTNYIAAVKALLDSAGITLQNLTSTTKTLPTDSDWAPGTEKLKIINDLLGAINYRSLSFNEEGEAVAQPYVTPSDRASEYTYRDDSQSVIFPEVEQSLDLFDVANKWTLVVSEPDRPPLVSTYTNNNPGSPTSTVNRGRTIVDYQEQQEAADQATLNEKVQRLAFEASQVYEQVNFETGIMPHHSDSDVYTLEFTALGIQAKYAEQSWEMPLTANGRMRHAIRRVVSI